MKAKLPSLAVRVVCDWLLNLTSAIWTEHRASAAPLWASTTLPLMR